MKQSYHLTNNFLQRYFLQCIYNYVCFLESVIVFYVWTGNRDDFHSGVLARQNSTWRIFKDNTFFGRYAQLLSGDKIALRIGFSMRDHIAGYKKIKIFSNFCFSKYYIDITSFSRSNQCSFKIFTKQYE